MSMGMSTSHVMMSITRAICGGCIRGKFVGIGGCMVKRWSMSINQVVPTMLINDHRNDNVD